MVKFESRLPLWFFVIGMGSALGNVYFDLERVAAGGSEWPIVSLVSMTVVAAVFALGTRNRLRRPVLEVDDEYIVYGSVFEATRKRVKPSDVAEVVPGSGGKIVLRSTAGRDCKISLFEVAQAERGAARQAIDEAVSRASEP